MTYEQLQAYANRIGELVPQRSLVFILCENVIGSAAGYLAFLQNRSVPLLLDAGINQQLLADLIELYHPAWIYLPEGLAAGYTTDPSAGHMTGGTSAGHTTDPSARHMTGGTSAGHTTDLTAGYKADPAGADRGAALPGNPQVTEKAWGYVLAKTDFDQSTEPNLYDDLALLLTTSGSTGSPKLVRQSYQNIQANSESIAEYLEIDETERPITTLPMHYTYGLSVIQSHIMKGACILLTNESVIGKPFWDFFKKEQATSIAGVPYTYEMLKRIRFFRMDLPSLRTMTQAGGKILPELHREFAEYAAEKGKNFVVMYGQTEATARMGYLPADKALDKVGSMGIVIPGGSFDLIDVDGSEIM